MNGAVTTTVDLAAAARHAQPGACMFNPPVLDALMQAMVDGQRSTFWQVGRVLVEVRVLGVSGQPLAATFTHHDAPAAWSAT